MAQLSRKCRALPYTSPMTRKNVIFGARFAHKPCARKCAYRSRDTTMATPQSTTTRRRRPPRTPEQKAKDAARKRKSRAKQTEALAEKQEKRRQQKRDSYHRCKKNKEAPASVDWRQLLAEHARASTATIDALKKHVEKPEVGEKLTGALMDQISLNKKIMETIQIVIDEEKTNTESEAPAPPPPPVPEPISSSGALHNNEAPPEPISSSSDDSQIS